ncbi:exosome complex component RRP46 [Cryptotermes secundus]|uniref:exosome complex component RRP46 n=1 Tax=Cryptotermes secundus TaxID=105785 RepID=UPI000CD7BE76|nr:exosome complex component RRP46 [Cryptotermes secundus]
MYKMQIESEEDCLRPMNCQLNVLSRSDGSAMFTQGDTAVVTAVFGPAEVKPQRILIDKASVEALYRPKTGLPRVHDKMRETLIRNTCSTALLVTLHPRTSISIIVQEMQDSGGLLACAVNAACLALINSGIAMKFLVAAVSCMIDHEDNILIDPNSKQLKGSKASLTFVFDSIKKNIMACHTTGRFTQLQYEESLLKCRNGSDKIFSFYREIVRKVHQEHDRMSPTCRT